MPGKLLSNLKNVSRVVGGMTPETAETMVDLYRCIVNTDLEPTDCLTADLVKTTENAYRDVQIGFANEIAQICEGVGGDVWKASELVNKSPGRQMHLPGGGVGGHCILKDPQLLAYSANENHIPIRLIPAARLVNDNMPLHVADLVKQALEGNGKSLAGVRIPIMGYIFLENSDDIRNSPSMFLKRRQRESGAEVAVYRGDFLEKAEGCDAAVIMVKYSEYQLTNYNQLLSTLKSPILIDARNLMTLEMNLGSENLIYVIGRANL